MTTSCATVQARGPSDDNRSRGAAPSWRDINGDGKADMIASDPSSNPLVIVENHGGSNIHPALPSCATVQARGLSDDNRSRGAIVDNQHGRVAIEIAHSQAEHFARTKRPDELPE